MKSHESLILTNYFSKYDFVLFAQDTYTKWTDLLYFKNKRNTYLFTKNTSNKQHSSVSIVTHKGVIITVRCNQPCDEKAIFENLINLPVNLLEHCEIFPEVLNLIHQRFTFFDYDKQSEKHSSTQTLLSYTKTEERDIVIGCEITLILKDQLYCTLKPYSCYPEATSTRDHHTEVVGGLVTGLSWGECQEVSYILQKTFPSLILEVEEMEVSK